MGLQVQPPIFKWLQSQNLLKQGRRTSENKIQIPEDISMKFYDGVYIGLLIKSIIKSQPDSNNYEKLDAIKENSTPAIRLYNWNIVCEMVKKMGLVIQYAEKSRILNLEPAPVLKVIQFLYKMQQAQPSSAPTQPQPLKVDITEVQKKQLKQSSNILEFFVISISKNFKLSPQHTLNLFLDNNKYLAHLLVKGVKNSYEPIYALLADISNNMSLIVVTLFCTDEKQSVAFFLNAIKPALISKQVEVVANTLEVLNQMHNTYVQNSMGLDIVTAWMKEEGLNTVFFSIKRHPELFQKLISTIYMFIGQELYIFVQPVDKSLLWDSQSQKIMFLIRFLTSIPKQSIPQFCQSKSYANWIKYLVKCLKKSKQNKQMSALLSVMSWFWQNMEQKFESNQNNLPNLYLAFLKTCSLHQSQLIFHESIIAMFHLMEVLGNRKNNNAPLIYKILINCFTFCGIADRITFIALNFKQSFQTIKNLPGSALVQPLLRNMQKQIVQDCITLCRVMIQENRINEQELIQIVQMLTSIIFHDVSYGEIAIDCIFDHISAMNGDMLEDYCEKNMKNTLAHFYSVVASVKKKFADLKGDYNRYGHDESFKKGNNAFTDQMKKHILLGNLVKFYERCANQSDQNKFALEPLLFHTYIRIKKQLKRQEQANLLLPLMKLSYQDEDQLEKKTKEYEQDLNPPKEKQKQDDYQSIARSLDNRQPSSLLNRSLNMTEKPSTPKPLDLSVLKPSSYAIKDLQKVKKKVQHLKTLEQKNQKEKDIIQQKKQLFRSVLNQKRIVQFGTKGIKNMQYKCIYEWGTAKEQDPSRMYGVPNIKLMNLDNQQQIAFVEDVDSILKKYRKVWRFLFFKYSSFGARNKDQIKTEQKINMAQIWKMLKQYQCMVLKKQQSHALVRMINQAMKRRNDLQNLTYLGFEEYIFQMCNYGYGKSGFAHCPPGQKIRMFIKQLRDMTAQRGGNIDLFQNPEEVYFQETQVIREFNKRLKENPEYILPQGYKKVKLTELYYDYQIHPANIKGFSSVYNDVLEVLDQIFSQCPGLGFHIIEPLTHKQEKNIAKPSMFQNLADKLKEQSKGTKGYLLPKKSPPATAQKRQRQQKMKGFKNQFHPHINFSLGIKIGLAGVNIKNRFIADEVAYWMDDMLDAIENGSVMVQNKAKKRIDNDALKRKRASLHKMKLEQKNQEVKWKKRAESVKAEVVHILQKRKQTQQEKRQKRRLQKQAQRQKQQQQMKKKLEEFKAAKDKLEQKRKEQENKRKQQVEKKKKQKQEYKKGVQQYFKKKKEELQQKQVIMKKNKQDQVKKQEQEEVKKKQFMKKLHMNILKKEQNVLQKIQDTKKGFEEVWTSKQIQDKFIDYQVPLKLLFDLLLKYEKSKISTTNNDELSLNTLQFFALKFKVVPFMIEKNNLAKIFKITGRSNESNTGVNFKSFKQTLFRIAVKAKQMLNGIVEKRKEMAKFLSKKSSDGGNHFQMLDEENSPSKLQNQSLSPKKISLTDDYLFNAQGVTPETIEQMLKFLNLPRDKLSMEQRYRQVIEQKNSKPKNILIKELKSSMQQI